MQMNPERKPLGEAGTVVDLHGYTNASPYYTQSDGFVYIAPQVANEFVWIRGFSAIGGVVNCLITSYVPKGVVLYTNASASSTVRFTEIN